MKTIVSFLKSLVFIFAILLLSGCSFNNDWTGVYYPDKNNIGDESKWVIMPGFKTVDDCRKWVIDRADNNDNYDYECGRGCKHDEDLGLLICKETVK